MKGTLTVDGRPVGGQDVLVLANGELLAGVVTDDRGTFSVDADGPVTVLAKVRSGAFGIASRRVAPGEPADLALQTPHTLDLKLSGEDLPARLDLGLDPVHLDGVDDALLPYARLRPGGVMDAHFGHRVVDLEGAELKLQPGTWSLSAWWEDPDRWDVPSYSGDARVVVGGDERVTLHVTAAE